MSNPKALVSKRQTTPEVADDDVIDVGAGITTTGEVLTIGDETTLVNIPGTVEMPTSAGLAAEFEIDGTAVSADVTADNLSELTGGESTALHEHAGLIKKSSVAFTLAELQALGAGVKVLEKTIALPTNARLINCTATGVTAFEVDQTDTFGITIGTSTGGTQVASSLNVAYGQTGFPKAFTAGAQGYMMASHSGATFYVKLTSADDLNTTVAGAATVNVFYTLVP
jgi:hypothetical protein